MDGLKGILSIQESKKMTEMKWQARIFNVKQEREFECRVTKAFECRFCETVVEH